MGRQTHLSAAATAWAQPRGGSLHVRGDGPLAETRERWSVGGGMGSRGTQGQALRTCLVEEGWGHVREGFERTRCLQGFREHKGSWSGGEATLAQGRCRSRGPWCSRGPQRRAASKGHVTSRVLLGCLPTRWDQGAAQCPRCPGCGEMGMLRQSSALRGCCPPNTSLGGCPPGPGDPRRRPPPPTPADPSVALARQAGGGGGRP